MLVLKDYENLIQMSKALTMKLNELEPDYAM
jgi:hypothetical protein